MAKTTHKTEIINYLAAFAQIGPIARRLNALMSSRLHTNNFDLLRFLFAGIVVLVHAHALSGHRDLEFLSAVLSSEVAVRGFFVVSGILVFMSYEKSRGLRSYINKRIRRIYPAYFVAVMLGAIVLVTQSTQAPSQYFSLEWVKYVLANLVFLNFVHPTLPGVFPHNLFQEVNGALWTLKIEVMFYASIPVIVLVCRHFGHVWTLGAIYAGSVAYTSILTGLSESTGSQMYLTLARQLPGQMTYFVAGALIYYHLDVFEKHLPKFLILAVCLLILHKFYRVPALEPLALAIVVAFFGFFLYVGNFGKYGDFSYGIYILHFPILQVMIHAGYFERSPYLALVGSCVLVFFAAVLMWNLVERRFLLRSSHYVTSGRDELKQ